MNDTSSKHDKTFTFAEVLDILQKISTEEDEACESFYKNNPDAGGKRRLDGRAVHNTIMRAMLAFDEAASNRE